MGVVQEKILENGTTEAAEVLLIKFIFTAWMHYELYIEAFFEAIPAELLHNFLLMRKRWPI